MSQYIYLEDGNLKKLQWNTTCWIYIINLKSYRWTYSFPAIWIQERSDLSIKPRNRSWLSSYLSSKLLGHKVHNLRTLVYIISANCNLKHNFSPYWVNVKWWHKVKCGWAIMHQANLCISISFGIFSYTIVICQFQNCSLVFISISQHCYGVLWITEGTISKSERKRMMLKSRIFYETQIPSVLVCQFSSRVSFLKPALNNSLNISLYVIYRAYMQIGIQGFNVEVMSKYIYFIHLRCIMPIIKR